MTYQTLYMVSLVIIIIKLLKTLSKTVRPASVILSVTYSTKVVQIILVLVTETTCH